ncbi:MAG: EAL domain-containing protein [Magnetococcales bacterium]|nr:EAL domain-containing protein [Magnetococcales bacterium]
MLHLRRKQLLSISTIIGLIAVVIAVGFFNNHNTKKQIMELGEQNNIALTRSIVNSLWPALESLVTYSAQSDDGSLAPSVETDQFKQLLSWHVKDLSIAKVKVYNLDGVTVFSSQDSQIGDLQSDNEGVVQSLSGNVLSEITFKETFPSFDGVVEDRSLISSYVPLRQEIDGEIVGALELYRDVTPLLAKAERDQWYTTLGVGAILLTIVIVLLGVVWRMDCKIKSHENARRRYTAQIEKDKVTLEDRIFKRTQALADLNESLQIEVSVRRQAESELRLAGSVYENTSEGIVITDPQGVVQSVNPAFTAVTGYESEEIVGQNMSLLKSGRQGEDFYNDFWEQLGSTGKWRGEFWNRRKNGEIYPEQASINSIRDGRGGIEQFVKVFSDVSEIKKSEQQLQFLVHHDPLTGLPNRLLLLDRMQRAFSYANRFEQMVAILSIGIDRFKMINDTAGRAVGDQLLKRVGLRLSSCLRDEDSIARAGGDEFLILATGILEVKSAAKICKKIMEAMKEPFTVDDKDFYVSVSIGISIYPYDKGTLEDYLGHAEKAMQRAKEKGGDQTEYYTTEMGDVSSKRLALENGLRHALEKDQLFLMYQPQIDVATGRLLSVEALVRWKSPELGLISPANFIPLAEESNLIIAIGEWVLRTACQQAVVWQEEGFAPIRIAVNLSARQFLDNNLMDIVERALYDTGLDPKYLELELTEGMFMKDVNETIALLEIFKKMGLKISIDDFGTGYSSLSYLKRFPIHTLKIDRAFIRDITKDSEDAAITKTIISMAKNLNLQVVAEGVASSDQLEFLRELGCDLVQGFLFSPPVFAEELSFFLEEDRIFRDCAKNDEMIVPKLHMAEGETLHFPCVA